MIPVARCSVAIVGGGFVGAALAHFLTLEGIKDVLVVERDRVGMGASGANAGTLSFQNKDVRLAAFASASIRQWQELDESLHGALGYVRVGGMRFATCEAELETLYQLAEAQQAFGIPVRTLEGKGLADSAPYFGAGVLAANYCAEDGYVDPLIVSQALLARAEERGVRVWQGASVVGISEHSSGASLNTTRGTVEAEQVVVAAGPWSVELLRPFGVALPLEIRMNQLLITERVRRMIPHVVTNVKGDLTLKQLPAGTVIIGGGWQGLGEWPHGHPHPALETMIGNASVALQAIPGLGDLNLVRAWSRFDTRSPDKLPVAGRIPGTERLWIAATGYAGLTFGILVSRGMASWLANTELPWPLHEYAPDRHGGYLAS